MMKQELQREDPKLSPSELNRYIYCSYQWYYERLYGRKELAKLAKERNEKYHLKDTTFSHFSKGSAYHEKMYVRQRGISLRRCVVGWVCLLVILYLYAKGKGLL